MQNLFHDFDATIIFFVDHFVFKQRMKLLKRNYFGTIDTPGICEDREIKA